MSVGVKVWVHRVIKSFEVFLEVDVFRCRGSNELIATEDKFMKSADADDTAELKQR